MGFVVHSYLTWKVITDNVSLTGGFIFPVCSAPRGHVPLPSDRARMVSTTWNLKREDIMLSWRDHGRGRQLRQLVYFTIPWTSRQRDQKQSPVQHIPGHLARGKYELFYLKPVSLPTEPLQFCSVQHTFEIRLESLQSFAHVDRRVAMDQQQRITEFCE